MERLFRGPDPCWAVLGRLKEREGQHGAWEAKRENQSVQLVCAELQEACELRESVAGLSWTASCLSSPC